MYNFEKFLKFLKKNKHINKIKIDFLSNNFIIQNNKLLLNIINTGFNEANNNTDQLNYKNQFINNGINGNSFVTIPIQFRKEIINTYNHCTQYNFKINKRSFNIYINSSSFFNDKLIIKKMYNILFFFTNIASDNKCSQILNIYIYFTNFKKELPLQINRVLDREHINSAFTYSCSTNNEIYIFREEEVIKSLIHECIHAFGLDFSQKSSKYNDIYASKLLRKYFPINFDLYLYEAYVDFFAIYLNLLFLSFYKTNNKNNDNFYEKVLIKVNNMLNEELLFSMFQSTKVLKYNNINYLNIVSNDSIVLNRYDENTPIFSYFIIKTILLYNFNDFFIWCIKNNKNIIDFNCLNKNTNTITCKRKIKSFCDFIIKKYNSPDIIRNMMIIQEYLSNIDYRSKLFKTLRFTIYG